MTFMMSMKHGDIDAKIWTGNRLGYAKIPENKHPLQYSKEYTIFKQGGWETP